jgi:aminoglycoside phosphotransferase
MERNVSEAHVWAERLVGGRIVRKIEQARWRAQWSLEIETPDGKITKSILRGWREGGITDDEQKSRIRLRREASILKALESTPAKSPHFYGYTEIGGGWVLMESIEGNEMLTELQDEELKTRLFTQYLENFAALHSFDPTALTFDESMHIPRDAEHCATWSWHLQEKVFRAQIAPPNPVYEFAFWWLNNHRPDQVDKLSLCTGDVGANQFMFKDGEFVSIFDVEMGYVGDPLQDMGLMRYRNMCYPIEGFPIALTRYLELLGRPNVRDSLNYWTVVGFIGVSPTFQPSLLDPSLSTPPSMSLIWSMQQRRRGMMEVFHDIYGLERPAYPPRPDFVPNPYAKLNKFVAEELRDYYRPRATDDANAFAFKLLQGHAEMLQVCNAIGPAITRQNLEDLASVLGSRPADEESGLYALQRAIRADPEKDIPQRLGVMYRIEARAEFISAPVQQACGFGTFSSLDLLGRT